MRKLLEKDIERKLAKGVEQLGGRSYKWVSPGNTGVPDRIVIFPDGRVEFVELKTISGKVRPLQRIQINRLQRLGCTVHILYGELAVHEYLGRQARILAERGDAT